MVNTLRHRRSLFILSTHGSFNQSNNSWDFTFQDPITHDKDIRNHDVNQSRIGVLNANMPMSFYVVTATTNTLRISKGGVASLITIPVGNYSPSSLVTILNQLTVAEMGETELMVWDFDSSSLRLIVTVDRSGSDVNEYQFGGTGSTVGYWFGLSDNGAVTIASGETSGTTPNLLDLSGPRYIFVDVDLPVESSDTSNRARGVLCAIPVGAPSGTIQYWQPSTVQYHLTSFDQLRSLNVRLTDENHNILDFNNVVWAMEIEFI